MQGSHWVIRSNPGRGLAIWLAIMPPTSGKSGIHVIKRLYEREMSSLMRLYSMTLICPFLRIFLFVCLTPNHFNQYRFHRLSSRQIMRSPMMLYRILLMTVHILRLTMEMLRRMNRLVILLINCLLLMKRLQAHLRLSVRHLGMALPKTCILLNTHHRCLVLLKTLPQQLQNPITWMACFFHLERIWTSHLNSCLGSLRTLSQRFLYAATLQVLRGVRLRTLSLLKTSIILLYELEKFQQI